MDSGEYSEDVRTITLNLNGESITLPYTQILFSLGNNVGDRIMEIHGDNAELYDNMCEKRIDKKLKKKKIYDIPYYIRKKTLKLETILKKLNSKIKLETYLHKTLLIFETYDIKKNDLIMDILTHKKITLDNFKMITFAYSKNKNIDLSLWDYMVSTIIYYERCMNIKYWEKVMQKIAKHKDVLFMMDQFMTFERMESMILDNLLIYGNWEQFLVLKNRIKFNYEIHDYEKLYECAFQFKKHQSFECLAYILNNITVFKHENFIKNFMRYSIDNNLTKNDIEILKLYHNKYGQQHVCMSKIDIVGEYFSLPMYLIMHSRPTLDVLKIYNDPKIQYDMGTITIYHCICRMNFKLYKPKEIIEFLEYYTNKLDIEFKKYDEDGYTPLGYLIRNRSFSYKYIDVLKYVLKYENLYQEYGIETIYFSKQYIYHLMCHKKLTSDMLYELIIENYIDPTKVNEFGENLLIMFSQNVTLLDSRYNKNTIDIFILLMSYCDVKQTDLQGNNVFSNLAYIFNFDLLKKLFGICGYDLLNGQNEEGITPFFRLVFFASRITYYESRCIITYLLKLNIPLIFATEDYNVFDYIRNRYVVDLMLNRIIKDRIKVTGRIIFSIIESGHFTISKYKLLEKYIDYNYRDQEEYDIFLDICEHANFNVIKMIVEHIKNNNLNNMNYLTCRGENALLVAAYRKDNIEKIKIIKYLIDNQIDINKKDSTGRTFYNLLYTNDKTNTINKLIEEHYIDIYDDNFINFVMIENIKEYLDKYELEQKVIEYNKSVEPCIICKDEINEDEKFYMCRNDGNDQNSDYQHVYHDFCITNWFKTSKRSNCVMCMKNLYLFKEIFIKK